VVAPGLSGEADVEPGSTCTTWPGTNDPLTRVAFMRGASAQCSYFFSNADGGVGSLGSLWKLEDGQYLACSPAWGGLVHRALGVHRRAAGDRHLPSVFAGVDGLRVGLRAPRSSSG
jgi:hypothetical protein